MVSMDDSKLPPGELEVYEDDMPAPPEELGVGGTRCFREKAAMEDSAAEDALRAREDESMYTRRRGRMDGRRDYELTTHQRGGRCLFGVK